MATGRGRACHKSAGHAAAGDHSGRRPHIVELAIDREPGELTDTNNRAIALIDGIRENLRVLLSASTPANAPGAIC